MGLGGFPVGGHLEALGALRIFFTIFSAIWLGQSAIGFEGILGWLGTTALTAQVRAGRLTYFLRRFFDGSHELVYPLARLRREGDGELLERPGDGHVGGVGAQDRKLIALDREAVGRRK